MDGDRKGELETDGYCVIRGVLNEESICSLRSMIDRELHALPHMAHSEAMWKLRTLPEVRKLFEFLYDATDLIVSFDGVTVKVAGGSGLVLGNHVDQTQDETRCVQCVIALTESNRQTGTLQLLKGSHVLHAQTLRTWHPDDPCEWQFMQIGADDTLSRCELVCPDLAPGDAVLWDSRLVHSVSRPLDWQSVRLVAYVCMVPRAWASARTLRRRKAAFLRGASSTHWPHLFVPRGERNGPSRSWAGVSPDVAALV
tara:strand:- start:30 stop:794 length:765 start_codon:yes stop_codon:yes gene_type:complete